MPAAELSGNFGRQSAVYGLLAVCCGAVTVWAATRGSEPLTVLLFAALTAYLLGVAVPQVRQRVPHYRRVAAIPLGLLGAVAAVLGAASDLPVFLVLLGVGSVIDLRWDPTGDVYGDQSD